MSEDATTIIHRYMEKYIKLMQILQPIVSEGLCQLFELFFFTAFKVFGDREFLAAPLRSGLVRISQGLEEQPVQLRSSPKRTSSTGPPISSGRNTLPLDPSPASGRTVLAMAPSNLFALKGCDIEHRVVDVNPALSATGSRDAICRSCATKYYAV